MMPTDCSVLCTPTILLAPLRSVLNMCHWHIAPQYSHIVGLSSLLCSYRGGFQGLSSTYEQAHVDLDLLTPGIIVLSFCNHLHFAVCSIFLSSIYLLICPHTHIIFPVLFQFFEDNVCFSGAHFLCFAEFFIIRIADLIAICLFHFPKCDFRFCCTGSHCLKFFRCCQFFDFWRILALNHALSSDSNLVQMPYSK